MPRRGKDRSEQSRRRNKEAKCFKCNEAGYFKRDCLLLKKGKKKRKEKNSFSVVADGEVEEDLLVVLEAGTRRTSGWKSPWCAEDPR